MALPANKETAAAPVQGNGSAYDTRSKPLLLPARGFWLLSFVMLCASSIGLWLFSRGFLLTRMVLPDHSSASVLPYSHSSGDVAVSSLTDASASVHGWYPAKFDRTIVFIIDALRIDFAAWSEELDAKLNIKEHPATDGLGGTRHDHRHTSRIMPYHNRLPVLHSLSAKFPEQTMLYRFRADPPTTTLQRLKALTTGQLPTFIDAGSNFAGSAIEEDNWLQAMRRPSMHNCNATDTAKYGKNSNSCGGFKRNLVFLGDDTWMSLFPSELSDTCALESDATHLEPADSLDRSNTRGWTRSRPFPSLNVWDLDTVDDGVLSRLPLFLLPPESEEHTMDDRQADSVRTKRQDWRRLVKQQEMLSHPDIVSTRQNSPSSNNLKSAMASDRVGPLELHREWDVIIAHGLGVDHCGHRFGPDHPTISQKLSQMNKAIEYIVDSIDNSEKSTALFVFGDHGMDLKGDHGGDSPREVDAALWIYSNKKWNTKKGAERAARVMEHASAIIDNLALGSSLDQDIRTSWWLNTHLTDDYSSNPNTPTLKPTRLRSIPQIDFVSTLSLSLGLPIPFNNLGAVIPELFASDGDVQGEWGLLRALRLNAAQVMRYLATYTSKSHTHGFSNDALHAWKDMYDRAETSYRELSDLIGQNSRNRRQPRIEEFEEKVAAEYHAFLRLVLGTLRQMWAQFDPALIFTGLCIIILTVIALVLLHIRSQHLALEEIVSRTWKVCFTSGIAAGIVFRALASVQYINNTMVQMTLTDTSIAGYVIGFMLAFCAQLLCKQDKPNALQTKSLNMCILQMTSPHMLLNGTAYAAAILHSLAFTSNSFTFSEDAIVHYLLQSLLLVVTISGWSVLAASNIPNAKRKEAAKRAVAYALAIIVLNRISLYSTVCREEQLPGGCVPTFYGSPSASITGIPLSIANLAMVWLVPYVILRVLQQSQSHRALVAKLWIGVGLRISMAMAALYWVLDSIDGSLASGEASPKHLAGQTAGAKTDSDWSELRIVLARMALGVALGGGLSAWLASPFCLDVAIADTPQASQPTLTPKRTQSKAKQQQLSSVSAPKQTAVILGYGNAFGAAYLVFVTVVFSVLYVFQQPMGGIMLSILLIKLILCAELFDFLRDALTAEDGTSTSSLVPAQMTVMSLLAYQGYFATGHQFTLVSIQWSTAFVGIREMQLYICGGIVALNTLGAFLLTAICVPLAVLWNESLGLQKLRLAPDMYIAKIAGVGAVYSAYQLIITVGSAVFAAWFRRHLMVWKVFAPRFMFSMPVFMTGLVVSLVAIGFAAMRVLRQGLAVGNAQALVAQKFNLRN
ncbi:mannose-ethanolamine phosphotransferase gpi13 [Coemansia spiralis]|uniref:Mannose-ethanolamine phosphotransferase gpi13 n=2 Tax=Coemansia TaxID=4863 RepID=A0A9W8G5R8_9FUNG|nr:mannose-ethanolamine phosphotransferase gpi13 [Coemansia umbellata]KAJ2624289.1 mannose-ethanolamine phosphotransferase gpi13 [Coemansia sp. RSA 1358]KAJ2675965.1 mannose-ethanolamine phosphotransferase gpi13 [Coemansia spiralis]